MSKQMNPVQYSLTFERIEVDHLRRVTYGIAARGAGRRMVIRDISTRRPEVEALVFLLNRCQVSILHFHDVIEDSLGV